MKKFNIIIIVISIIICIIAISGLVYLGMFLYAMFPPMLSKEATEKDFMKNKDDIMIVTDYLINSIYEDIHIHVHVSYGIDTMYADGEYIIIDDSEVIKAVKTLFKKGYSYIGKSENTIEFCRTSTMNGGSGVVYSIDGSEPILYYLTKLEQLSESNWYYYKVESR